jgi:HD-like signal output (HDOD) protein
MSTAATLTPLLQQPLRDLSAWGVHFLRAEIPVLTDTAETLEALRLNEDAVDANSLGEIIATDPLMSLKVMAHVSTHRSSRRVTDAETVTSALVLLGIGPFFRTFGPQPTIEERLEPYPLALAGLQAVLQRAHRGAKFALGFAIHRMDNDAAVIYQAALLHDFAEMLLWCHAPALAQEIAQRQEADPALRSNVAQREVLHIELADLQQMLMRAWRLPELLVQLSDDKHARSPQVRNVLLAIRLARHSARSWDNLALPDDYAEIAELLNLGLEPTIHLIREIDD